MAYADVIELVTSKYVIVFILSCSQIMCCYTQVVQYIIDQFFESMLLIFSVVKYITYTVCYISEETFVKNYRSETEKLSFMLSVICD